MKKELRNKYRKIRKQVNNKENKSRIICKKIIKSEIYQKSNNIALYSSTIDEVNTEYLITYALSDNKHVLLPKVICETEMKFYEIKSMNDLDVGYYGIYEPKSNSEVLKEKIELMIVPGVCFDNYKNRMGMGKGFYDRYLNNSSIYKIGICFDEQLCEIIECDEFDIKMNEVITDKRII